MRILLPPSEAKRAGGRGKPLSQRIGSPLLREPRAELRGALTHLLAAADTQSVGRALCLPPSTVAAVVQNNRNLDDAPTLPAIRRYAGVVYEGLDYDGLSAAARRVVSSSVLILSGLFGVLTGAEATPLYRVPAKAVLPGIGHVGAFWRGPLAAAMPDLLGGGLIVDLRSADYAAMWKGSPSDLERSVTVRILSPRPDDRLAVLSYPSKFGKGRLAAGLLERAAGLDPVRCAEDVVEVWLGVGGKDGRVQDSAHGSRIVELTTWSARRPT